MSVSAFPYRQKTLQFLPNQQTPRDQYSYIDQQLHFVGYLNSCLALSMTVCCKVSVLFVGTVLLITVQVTITEFNKVFTRCGLARELFKFGMPKNQLNDCKYFNTLPSNT